MSENNTFQNKSTLYSWTESYESQSHKSQTQWQKIIKGLSTAKKITAEASTLIKIKTDKTRF